MTNAMQPINIHEAKTHLSRLLDQASAGEEIVIARAGRPIARLVPLTTKKSRTLGLARGQLRVSDAFGHARAEDIAEMFNGQEGS